MGAICTSLGRGPLLVMQLGTGDSVRPVVADGGMVFTLGPPPVGQASRSETSHRRWPVVRSLGPTYVADVQE